MAVGLSVYQTVKTYEDALDRHGQYVRWYSSSPCYCLSSNGEADPHCTKCKGRGYRYFPVTTRGRLERKMSMGDNILTTDYEISSINSMYKGNLSSVSYNSFSGKTITLSSSRNKGEYIYIDYEEKNELNYSGTDVTSLDSDSILKVGFPAIETINGSFKGEIVSISAVTNVTQGSNIEVISYRDDLIKIDENNIPLQTDVIQVNCVYVNPVKVLISNVKYKTFKGNEIVPTDQAEVQVTVPGTLEIGRGDIFSLLKAEQKGSFVGRWDSSGEDFYQAPFFDIAELLRIEDSTGLITDAVIQNNNEILFTTKPTGNFSCLLKYRPSFMIDENPDPRNAENKIFPRKSKLKRLDVLNKKTKSPRFDDEVIY
jgi:hypothetical protein